MSEVSVKDDVALEALVGQVADEFLRRQAAGEHPDIEEYAARHPEVADVLRKVLASLQLFDASHSGTGNAESSHLGDGLAGTLGDFRLVREVGRGGMGIVYEAEQISLSRRVALKVLPFAATMDPRHLQRFHNEARAAAGLHHTNIVPVHYVGCERGVHFYAMQFIEGQSLAAILEQQRSGSVNSDQPTTAYAASPPQDGPAAQTAVNAATPTTPALRDTAYFRQVAEWGIQAAEALDHAHQMGIVHRDVKPANLLVDSTGRLWVTDFGLAQIQSDVRLTQTGDLVGTLRYMSPEQALAQRVVIDHRTDVYSLGATLYELLTLRPAFSGIDRQELLRQIAFEEPRPPRKVCHSIPADLEVIVLKAMEKNPPDRYATVKELADDLRRWLDGRLIQARRPTLVQRTRKWARRHRALVGSIAAVLTSAALILVGSVGWVARDQAARQHEAEGNVREALEAALPGLQQGNSGDPALIAAAQRAKTQLGSGLLSSDWRRKAEQLQKDLHMLAVLELIRLDRAAVRDEHFDSLGSDAQYAKAFQEYGIDLEALEPRAVVALVQASMIREHLVAGLDDWSMHLIGLPPEELTRKRKQLLDLARQLDMDDWRNQLRALVLRKDLRALTELVRTAPVEELPRDELGLLGEWVVVAALRGAKISEPTLDVLRRAQQRFPSDFWINRNLAVALTNAQLPQWDEAIGFFRVAVALRPHSPGTHVNLGVALQDKGDLDKAMAEYQEAIRLKRDYATPHNNLAVLLRKKGNLDGAMAEFQKAIDIKHDYAFARLGLGSVLHDGGDVDGAIAEYQKAIEFKNDYPEAHNNLGAALKDKGNLDGAITECQKAIALKNDYAEAHYSLGVCLFEKGKLDGAIAEYQKTIAIKKDYAEAHCNLGVCLKEEGNLDGAIAEYQKAIAIKPDLPEVHINLGTALETKGQLDEAIAEHQKALAIKPDAAEARYGLGVCLDKQGKPDEAIAEYQKAIAIKNDFAWAHNNLGKCLAEKGKLDEAIAEFKKAVAIKNDDAKAHGNLGSCLAGKGKLEEAIAEYKQVIAIKNDDAEAHCNLGHILRDKGRFAEALTFLRRGHELGSKNPQRWPYPSLQWVKQCERLVELDGKLPRVLKGEVRPTDIVERLILAEICQRHRSLYVAAVRFSTEAFSEQPKLADDLDNQWRYNAACAASHAGCDQGHDARNLPDKVYLGLRRQALAWLRADMAAYRQLLEKRAGKVGPAVRERLQHWQQDTDFASVRGPEALAKLPESERRDWQKLWEEVEALRQRAAEPTSSKDQPPSK